MRKIIIEVKFYCLLYFLRNIHKLVLSVKITDKEQGKLFNKLSYINKGEKSMKKVFSQKLNMSPWCKRKSS